ncbi:oar protein [Flavobacterium faecale]|uniref:Oar protein n=1 Tax=Flavobacterium faecale TaxID=1355330 RepID=A0A2S1LDC7_9FLAO|nr:carboxypeptidase regulatory-like domain-containing protein [Flavobacterium faecale]AWG21707.1 oar protein [Flavobacterium faecale]
MRKLLFILLLAIQSIGFAQVTKSSISGTVKSTKGEALPGATVEVIHEPTGSKYYATTDGNGRYSVPAIRPGGPYTVKTSFVSYTTTEITEISAPLGNNITINVSLKEETNALKEVVIKSTSGSNLFSKNKTGASQQFSTREINSVPVTGSRSISSVTKYSANAGANGSFGGQDSRLNNFTIDGSVFNNGFGLGGDAQAGGRTGSTAISMDAIEQLQVNIAPFDVRQSGFLGTGINAVTRSGSNEVEGSVYHSFQNNSKTYLGTKAGDNTISSGKFNQKIYGARLGMPIIKNKLFFFGNFETVDNVSPATNWIANDGSGTQTGQVTRTTVTDLNLVSKTLFDNFGYVTGPYQGYDANSTSTKYLARIDWNINDNNKLNVRYVHHDSESDQLVSNSTSAGAGNRRTNVNSLSYQNSGYTVQDNTRSIVLELDSKLSNRTNNNFIAGYDKQIEDRGLQGGGIFPTIDILDGNATYISAGLDPFTKGNKLDYSTLHFTDNLTVTAGKHTIVFGANYERFISNNSFIIANNAAYTFNSLASFIATMAEASTLNGVPTTVNKPSRTQYNYSLLGGDDANQVFKSNKIDLYAQDNIKVSEKLNITFGLRASQLWFANTGIANKFLTGYTNTAGVAVAPLTFADGQTFDSGKGQKSQLLFEPRVGFNLDVYGDKTTQLRGGSGIFTGRPPYVLLSNAIGNSGAITNGFSSTTSGFTADPGQYLTPSSLAPSPKFQLNATADNYKFPQVWKSTIAIDQKLPFGFTGTVESIFGQNINAATYYDANLDAPVGTFGGTDNRTRFARTDAGVRVQDDISGAYVLTSKSKGYFYSTTFKLEYAYQRGLWGSLAYTHSGAYDLNSVGSTAASAYNGTATVNGNNNLTLSNSSNNTPHRIVGTLGYKIQYGGEFGGATSFSLGYIGEQTGANSYTVNGDLNGDQIRGNDLIYVPNSASELRFDPLVASGVTYTEAQQRTALDAYINQDSYLSERRGQYAQRNASTIPMLHRMDLSVTQDFFIKAGKHRNSLQVRADILNFTNMINKNWGVSQRFTNTSPLVYVRTDAATNTPIYKLGTQTVNGTSVLLKDTYQKNTSTSDVWQAQLTLRYTFGR